MEVINIINRFEDSMEEASNLPFSNKKILDRDMIMVFLEELRCNIPEDIKKAVWIQDERAKILADTRAERERLLAETQELVSQMVADHEIVRQAQDKSREMLDEAAETSMNVKNGAKEYANRILEDIEIRLHTKLEEIDKDKRELQKY
ncbi:MAG: hypothetical protein WCQ41_07630 [Bacillota bacterium]